MNRGPARPSAKTDAAYPSGTLSSARPPGPDVEIHAEERQQLRTKDPEHADDDEASDAIPNERQVADPSHAGIQASGSALRLEVAAPRLLDLDRLEERLEVADAEAARRRGAR